MVSVSLALLNDATSVANFVNETERSAASPLAKPIGTNVSCTLAAISSRANSERPTSLPKSVRLLRTSSVKAPKTTDDLACASSTWDAKSTAPAAACANSRTTTAPNKPFAPRLIVVNALFVLSAVRFVSFSSWARDFFTSFRSASTRTSNVSTGCAI